MEFAPLPKIEKPAQMLANTACAAIEHEAQIMCVERQKQRKIRLEIEAEEKRQKEAMAAAARSVRVTCRIATSGVSRGTGVKVGLIPGFVEAKAGLRKRASEVAKERHAEEERVRAEAEADTLEVGLCVHETLDKMRLQFDAQRATSLKAGPRSLEEVVVMASYLGLPFGGEVGVEHLWIADAALCPQVPLGWVSHEGDEGQPFYQNVWSGEKMWEHPQVAFLRGAVQAIANASAALVGASDGAKKALQRRKHLHLAVDD